MKYIRFLIIVGFISCGHNQENIQLVFTSAENNSAELQKVIDHFEKKADAEKLKAAYFLIGNMMDKYAHDGEALKNFDVIFDILDSLHRNNIQVPVRSPIVKKCWDSIIKIFGPPLIADADIIQDLQVVNSKYLIDNIEWAFKVKNEYPWTRHLSFEQFWEYILPYRIGNEQIEPWREHLYKKFKPFSDSIKTKDLYSAAEAFNYKIRSNIITNHTLWGYPFDMTVKKMEKGRRGACRHVVMYTAKAMRANGLPIGIDYTPLWGTVDRGHEWTTVLLENGKHFPFDAGGSTFGNFFTYPYRFSKVFRMRFAQQDIILPPENEVPSYMLDKYRVDVTNEYTKTFDIAVPLTNIPEKKKYALICSYKTTSWGPQDWGIIENNKAHFKKMGSNVMYMAMYYNEGKLLPASNPFILDKQGEIHFIEPSIKEKQTVHLLRKYPSFPANDTNMLNMLGGKFQVANKIDFSDSVNIFQIKNIPNKIELVEPNLSKPYRYLRYVTPNGKRANVAEIEVYEKTNSGGVSKKLTGQPMGFPKLAPEIGTGYENAFDNDLETYFTTEKKEMSWVGIDLQKPVFIKKLKFCPRSDTNFILEGDTYELCYWINGKWVSLGKKIATKQVITYTGVPSNALYLLHNLSRGKEERIFTIENGKQVWW